jgi:hypothetical protein
MKSLNDEILYAPHHLLRKCLTMKRLSLILLVMSFVSACQTRTPSADMVATAIEETAIMKQTLEPPTATWTEAPTQTATTAMTATASPSPTATLSLHPIQLYDDFSSYTINWLACEVCEYKNGALYIGPYPVSGARQPHFAVCQECGLVTYYRMSVVATYQDGPTDRGYGLLLRSTDDYMIILEIYSWQIVGLLKLDLHSNQLEVLDASWSGAVKAGASPNHIEVYVTESQQRRTDISVSINGKVVFIVWGQPKDQSEVGLMVSGHALEVSFDDFEFEEYKPYGDPIELEDIDMPSGG